MSISADTRQAEAWRSQFECGQLAEGRSPSPSGRGELYSPGVLPNSMTVDSGLGREYLMDRRGSGVDVILAESEKLSGKNQFTKILLIWR